jgi:hypothetical protein
MEPGKGTYRMGHYITGIISDMAKSMVCGWNTWSLMVARHSGKVNLNKKTP